AGLELPAHTSRAFGEPSQPAAVASRRRGGAAVVVDLDGGAVAVPRNADVAVLRVAVPDDVGRALANSPGEDRLDLGRDGDPAAVDAIVDAGSGERGLGTLERLVEPEAPVAEHRTAHFGECLATHGVDVRELGCSTARVSLDELPRELALQRDHGQAVT